MIKSAASVALGLSIIASSLMASERASAFQLRNAVTDFCMGVAAGTPTAGTKFVTWPCDNPISGNQNFSTAWDFNTPNGGSGANVIPGNTITLFNDVAFNAIADFAAAQPSDGTTVAVEYSTGATKEKWLVDDTWGIRIGGRPCYRFINAISPGGVQEAIGVAGGSTQKGTTIITWRTFTNIYAHFDQFWCVAG